MTKSVVLTGVGRDRVGIVAELTQVLYQLGCNLLDSSMTLLSGEFALILMADLPDSVSIETLEKRLAEIENQLGMKVHVRERTPDELQGNPEPAGAFIVSVYGADRPGIVAKVTRELAKLDANITDVQTKQTGGSNKLFVMILEITTKDDADPANLQSGLREAMSELSVDISVQKIETHEL